MNIYITVSSKVLNLSPTHWVISLSNKSFSSLLPFFVYRNYLPFNISHLFPIHMHFLCDDLLMEYSIGTPSIYLFEASKSFLFLKQGYLY